MDRALGTKEKKKPKLKPTGIANNSIKQGDKSSSKVKSKKIPGASSRRDETPLPLQNDYPNQWLEDESSIVDTDHKSSKKQSNRAISLSLLSRRCLGSSSNDKPPELVIQELNKLSHVRLDREDIQVIDGLELLSISTRNLYLQHNEISTIEGLETLQDLRFLTLSHNNITRLENLRFLKNLGFLDLSYNQIQTLDAEELPASLVILSLEGNPCQTQPNYRSAVLEYCTQLCQLDGETLGSQERRAAGHEVDSDNDSDGDDNDDDNDNDDGDIGAGISNRQDAFDTEIIGVFDDLSDNIFLRCQSRIQNLFSQHRERLTNMETIRQANGINDDAQSVAISSTSSRLNSPDTSDSSRPATGSQSLR